LVVNLKYSKSIIAFAFVLLIDKRKLTVNHILLIEFRYFAFSSKSSIVMVQIL
jgi:hypothetical protein